MTNRRFILGLLAAAIVTIAAIGLLGVFWVRACYQDFKTVGPPACLTTREGLSQGQWSTVRSGLREVPGDEYIGDSGCYPGDINLRLAYCISSDGLDWYQSNEQCQPGDTSASKGELKQLISAG
jgi:hypothetical protein